MYTYRLSLLFVYFFNFRKTFGSPDGPKANTVVTYELKNLEEHGHVTLQNHDHAVKHLVFDPAGLKTVNKVAYDGTDLWVPTTDAGKVFKKLEVFEKGNLLQLVDLTLTNGTQEEHLYFKKVKGKFDKLDDVNKYNELVTKLKTLRKEFVDEWFPLDLHNKNLYSKFCNEKLEMVDGVWRKILNFAYGDPYVARDRDQKLWDLETDTKKLGSVREYNFGDGNKLMELSLHDGVKKYFSRLGETASTWTHLEQGAFNTKVTELKSKFFENPLEFDLAVKPDLQKFVLQLRSDVGNSNDLTLTPVRNYYVNKVKFKDSELWSSNSKEQRVVKLKLFLLAYEVHLVQLYVANDLTTVEPRQTLVYLYKDNGVFKNVDKNQYRQLLTKVKAAADRTKPFVYRNDWVATNATLYLTTYNTEEWTVVNETLTNGVLKKTLTPKEGLTFTSLVYLGQTVLPNQKRPFVDLLLKTVHVYFKKNLVQLVHVNGTRTVTNLEGKSVNEAFDLYLKKDRDDLNTLTNEQFEEYLKLLKDDANHFVDNFVHLDLADNLNSQFFTETTDFEDGVNKKVVTANGVKVTKLTHNNFEFFRQTPEYRDKYVTHFELFTVGDAQLLTVHYNTVASNTLSRVHFEKRNAYTEWADFNNRTFNVALNAYKGVANWTDVELDVGVKPDLHLFHVDVNPLKGNKTELVLKPMLQKRLTKVKFGNSVLWQPDDNAAKRVFRVNLYLEAYEPKHLLLDVVADGRFDTATKTQVKKTKETSGFVDDAQFDTKLATFKTSDDVTPFTYNANWVLPPTDFDPVKFNADAFEVSVATEGLVETKKFVPKKGTVVSKVTFDGAKVWPLENENVENTTKKLEFLEVLHKDNLVQLLRLQNNLENGQGTSELLHFKKVMGTFEKVELTAFTELKTTLAKPDTYVDNNVKLDLSAEVPPELFKKESTLEDGVEKEVVELKVGKLYEVKASPALWTSTDGSYVNKLERYTLEDTQLLVLYVTDKNGAVEKKFFEKPLTKPVAPEATSEPAGPATPMSEETRSADETQPRTPEPAKPLFSAMADKAAFFAKLKTAKAAVEHTELTLNLNAYRDETKFRVLESNYGNAKLYKLYPLPSFWVTQLNSGDTKLWEKKDEAFKLVEVLLYLHDAKVKFVKAVVWPKERVDDAKDSLLLLKLDLSTNKYEEVTDKSEFEKALEEETKLLPTPLPLSTGGMLATKTREYRKLFLAEEVDPLLFEHTTEKNGLFTLRRLAPKPNVFVNLLETRHGVLWKAEQTAQLLKGALFSLKDNTGHVDLTLTDNLVENHRYYKFEGRRWMEVNKDVYDELNKKVSEPVAQRTEL